MLPEFKRLKNNLRRKIFDDIQEYLNNWGILSEIRKKKEFEGDLMEIKYPDGNTKQTEYKEFGSILEIKENEFKQLIDKGLGFYFKKIRPVINEISQKQRTTFIEILSNAAESVDNTIDLQGKGFTLEAYLLLLNKIEIDFNNEGKPYIPMMFFSNPDPEVKKKFDEKAKEYQQTDEFKKIIDKKRKEFYDRESNRKLVD